MKEQYYAKDVLIKFKENYNLIRDYIDNIVNSLIRNIATIPYTVRCICKIINTLINKKVNNNSHKKIIHTYLLNSSLK